MAKASPAEEHAPQAPPTPESVDAIITALLDARNHLTREQWAEAYERVDFSTRLLFVLAEAMQSVNLPKVKA